jgi:ATP-dependent RNA helicase DDX27
VEQRLQEERVEKEERLAMMEANKASNMMEHADEIKARPARSWFQTEKEKQQTRVLTAPSDVSTFEV